MIRLFKSLSPLLFITLTLASCSYITPPEEQPVPTEFGVGKSFFQTIITQTFYTNENQGTKVTIDTARKLNLLVRDKGNLLAQEHEQPKLSKFAKNNGWKEVSKTVLKPRTFLCGWSPESTAGKWGNYIFDHYNYAEHCNIEFTITENELVGRMVIPSKVDDRSLWPNVITIPITKHYHYEHPRDKYGREQKSKYIENTSQDHWSQRPSMTLDLRGMKIKEWAMDLFWGGHDVDKIEDIEWDYENNFLGFTLTATHGLYGSRMQGRFRFNFLEFKHDPSFKQTPYNQRNAKHLNVLHIMGEKVNGNDQILYAAKWDTRKKHTIHLNNFPRAYKQIGKDVINHWNDTFEKIGHGRPFEIAYRDGAKYTFDLRYPGITWVDDIETSMYAPLGVGMIAADVRNGKVLWGGVTVWGGLLEKIVNRYSPVESTSAMAEAYGHNSKPIVQLSLAEPESRQFGPNHSVVPERLIETPSREDAREMVREALRSKRESLLHYKNLMEALPQDMTARLEAMEKVFNDASDFASHNPVRSLIMEHSEAAIFEDLERYRFETGSGNSIPDGRLMITVDDRSVDLSIAQGGNNLLDRLNINTDIARQLSEVTRALNGENGYVDILAKDFIAQANKFHHEHRNYPSRQEFFNFDNFQKLIGFPTLKESADSLPFRSPKEKEAFISKGLPLTKAVAAEHLGKTIAGTGVSAAAFDMDRKASQVALQYQMGFERYGKNKIEALRPFAKDLLLHEVGHMIGLGHNFKENILPERGTVPSKYLDGKGGLIDRAKNHDMINYTTVMGYKNGVTDVITDYDDLKPGPMDELVLRYLYNQEYPAIPNDAVKVAAADTDFKFAKLGEDGIIHKQLVRVTYNDCSLDKGINPQSASLTDFNQCSQSEKEMIVPDMRTAEEELRAQNKIMINAQSEPYKLSYFPHCNDFTASMSYDPYCNRWDRGYDALTLTQSYLDDYKAQITKSIYAFTDGKESEHPSWQQYRLWVNSLRTFGRARVFYDYMRQKFDSEIAYVLNGVGENKKIKTFLQFSKACQDGVDRAEIDNPALYELFHSDTPESQEIKSLCQASKLFISELNDYLQMSGPDYNFIDRFDRYISYSIFGGEGRMSWGAAFGKWKELSRMPIKTPALYTLTLPFPYVSWAGWVFPITQYTSNDGMFLMNTLYPKEYTEALAGTVAQNITFANIGQSKRTAIGKAVQTLGFLLPFNYFSNDALDVPTQYTKNLRSQANYKYNWAAVEINALRDKTNEQKVRKFKGSIYNLWGRGSEQIPEIYMYRENRTIIIPPSGSLILPYSDIRWYSKSGGYYWIIKLDYEDDYFDRLKTHSVRRTLESRYYKTMKACIEGKERSGLKYYFNDSISKKKFPGFDFPDTIYEHETSRNEFHESVRTYFDLYEANEGADGLKVLNTKPDPNACTAALRGQKVLVMAASAMNGYMFLDMLDYMEKDLQ